MYRISFSLKSCRLTGIVCFVFGLKYRSWLAPCRLNSNPLFSSSFTVIFRGFILSPFLIILYTILCNMSRRKYTIIHKNKKGLAMAEKYKTCKHSTAVYVHPSCPRLSMIKGILVSSKRRCQECKSWERKDE